MAKPAKAVAATRAASERDVRKEIKTLEQTIAQLDEQKRAAQRAAAGIDRCRRGLRLHNEVAALTTQLAEAEERWCELQEELEGATRDGLVTVRFPSRRTRTSKLSPFGKAM